MDGRGTLVSKAPNVVLIVCVTLLSITVVGSVVVLTLHDKDINALTSVLNVIFNFVTVILAGGAFAFAGAAAKRSDDAAYGTEHMTAKLDDVSENVNTQLNGELDKRIRGLVAQVIEDNDGKVPHGR